MADTTPVYGFPFLELADPPDLASATEDLAGAVETKFVSVDAAISSINGLSTAIATESTTQPAYSSTTFTAGSQVCGVAFTAPPSGMVVVHWKAYFQAAINDKMSFVGCEIRTGAAISSGTVVVAANSTDAIAIGGTVTSGVPVRLKGATYKLITSLTPGSAYHARLMYQTETGGNITVFTREVMVVPQL
jgi:hypothetical protein